MKKLCFTACIIYFLCGTNVSAQQTVGLFKDSTGNLDGYVLFAPFVYDSTYLIDKCGKLVHTWGSTHNPGLAVYLLSDGTLLRTGAVVSPYFNAGGKGGIIELFDWDSNLLWSYMISDSIECLHHDICRLPNGNILVIAWEIHLASEAIANGRNPLQVPDTLWSDKIIELRPIGTDSAIIVWQWRDWDHLIQDYDSTKLNYGVVSEHPELMNLNYNTSPTAPDWIHTNTVYYNAAKDQIIMCAHNFSEVLIIDHSTTTAQAASHTGGVSGKGGDLLYRWGNPASYNRGTTADQKFFTLHNAYWIPDGFKDSGKIILFNNGLLRPAGAYSSIEIFDPPTDSLGNYPIINNQPYQPDSSDWVYTKPVHTDFYSADMGGVQRLSNGNTLICNSDKGEFFEIDSMRNVVWDYICPVNASGRIVQDGFHGSNDVFRCTLYKADYPGFIGHTLTPGNPIEINPLNYTCDMVTNTFSISRSNSVITIYPNPASTNITLNFPFILSREESIIITDVLGNTVYQNSINETNNITVNISSWSNGVYFYELKGNKEIKMGKFVVYK